MKFNANNATKIDILPDGRMSIDLKAQSGQAMNLNIPAPLLSELLAFAQQLAESKRQQSIEGPLRQKGTWQEVPMCDPRQIEVVHAHMTTGSCIGLVLTPGTNRQVGYTLSPRDARAVAQKLLETADQIENPSESLQ